MWFNTWYYNDDNIKWRYFYLRANSLILLEENVPVAIEYYEKAAVLPQMVSKSPQDSENYDKI